MKADDGGCDFSNLNRLIPHFPRCSVVISEILYRVCRRLLPSSSIITVTISLERSFHDLFQVVNFHTGKVGEISGSASLRHWGEGCQTTIDSPPDQVSDLHLCAWLIRWKNGERKYIQSNPLWQICEQSHSFSFRLLCSSSLFLGCQAHAHRSTCPAHKVCPSSLLCMCACVVVCLFVSELDICYFSILKQVCGHERVWSVQVTKGGNHFPWGQQLCDGLNTVFIM